MSRVILETHLGVCMSWVILETHLVQLVAINNLVNDELQIVLPRDTGTMLVFDRSLWCPLFRT